MHTPDSIDELIGANLRRIRKTQKMSLEELSEKIGVSYQQVQKYETGKNRIACSKLWYISRVLNCGILDFYDGADTLIEQGSYLVKLNDPQEADIVLTYRRMGKVAQHHLYNFMVGLRQQLSTPEVTNV